MRKSGKVMTWMTVMAMSASICACDLIIPGNTEPSSDIESDVSTSSESTPDTVELTMFAAMRGSEKNEDNDIMELIAEKTGVRVKETWLPENKDPSEAINKLKKSSDGLPDLIDGGDGSVTLYENGFLVAWDEYLEKYPNLKEMYTDAEWDKFRMEDGHIYWANVFGNHYQKDTATVHNGYAFWIQVRVLEEYGYPEIKTLDEYFDILERYAADHPELPNGTAVIPYTCLCEDWKYYCLESAPQYLDGYPNNGNCIVNIDDGIMNPKVIDYNTTPTAERYFRKLNEEYQKGVIDQDFATMTYDEYIAELSTGRVLGMADQYWDFAYSVAGPFAEPRIYEDGSTYTLTELGCDYVPLGLTIDPGMTNQYYTYGDEINQSYGIAVTTSCEDPDLAFAFLNALLDQDIHDLRFWGIEGVDYLVDETTGLYYRTEEMRVNWADPDYLAAHTCEYSYMPQWLGMSRDGINRMQPLEQPSEYLATLPEPVSRCLSAYGANNYVDMLGSEEIYEDDMPWYSTWSWSDNIGTATPGGIAWKEMGDAKHKWLPEVVMSDDFDATWAEYMEEYNAADPQAFIDETQADVNDRLEHAVERGWTPG